MLLGKRSKDRVEKTASDLLNALEADALVVRGKSCHILMMNASAGARLEAEGLEADRCRAGYATLFPGICAKCPARDEGGLKAAEQFDMADAQGRTHSVRVAPVDWTDGKPAVMLQFHDVQEQRALQERLYNMAYIDQLTGAPNRQKFKEDFEQIAGSIEQEQRTGIVAIFDMDNFKAINDTYGHNTGDVMLMRLVEHLQKDPDIEGHVYRLGGDEFVLFYHYPVDRFADEAECREHHEKILGGALQSYTLPNIELNCTLSIGAAVFPRHGVSTSELLRKADIALYKAKEAGRDQLVFFEDQYDTAKKFKDLYINIQPILTNQGGTFGYELVDRGNDPEDGEEVTLADANRAIDALGLEEMDSEIRYFITYSNQLLGDQARRNLPKDKFIILMHLPPEPREDLMRLYRALKKSGYSLAFSGLQEKNAVEELFQLGDFFCFEPRASTIYTENRILQAHLDRAFIASNVHTQQDFDIARRRGFKLFQGMFFEQPPIVTKRTKDIDPMKVNYLRLLQLTSTDDYVDFREISAVIASDVVLSYKLLKLLNSAAVGLRTRMSSIEMAVAYLGENHLKKWIALLALRGVVSDKPLELMRVSLIRARFGELLAPHFRPKRDAQHIFLTGMFSLLHIALEKTKEELMEEIPMADDIRESILTRHGVYSDLLTFFSHYEYGNWEEVSRFGSQHQLESQLINDSYIAAVRWYNELADAE